MNRLREAHPLVAAFAIAAAAQAIGLVAHYFGRDAAGRPIFSAPGELFLLALALYLSLLLAAAALFFGAWSALGRARVIATTLGIGVALATLVIAPLDFGMQRFRGERLSISHFKTYSPGSVVNSDVVAPVFADPWYPAITLGVPLVAIALILFIAMRSRGRATRGPTWRAALACAVAALAAYLPTRVAFSHQRDLVMPPAILLAHDLLVAPEQLNPLEESAHRDELRRFLDPMGTARWLSPDAPLVIGGPPASTTPTDPPDVFIFVVESLRGSDVGYGLFGRADSPTPRLDSLAKESVVFPRYIASGEPSPRGFIGINAGVWEHRDGFIIANFPNLEIDALPARLRTRGYRTMVFWGGNPSFDAQLVWGRRWFDEVDFEQPGNGVFYFKTRPDHVVMDHVIDRVKAHDAARAGTPIFAYIASNGTHTPFEPEDGSAKPGENAQQRYDRCLRNLDAQIGRVLDHLASRARARNTVVIVLGDHADRTMESFDERLRGMPTDAAVWTAALIHGPARLVGAPRREEFAAGHVDLMPTILAWAGDHGPRVAFGHDLFAPIPPGLRYAVALNGRGYRLDRGGFTLLVPRDDPSRAVAYRSFPRGAPTFLPLDQTPFSADEPRLLAERVRYWSALLEEHRIWRPELAAPTSVASHERR